MEYIKSLEPSLIDISGDDDEEDNSLDGLQPLEFHMDYSLCPNYHHHSQVKFREDPHDDE
jgi:hypothetical protein